jgi:hypothetical protein
VAYCASSVTRVLADLHFGQLWAFGWFADDIPLFLKG